VPDNIDPTLDTTGCNRDSNGDRLLEIPPPAAGTLPILPLQSHR